MDMNLAAFRLVQRHTATALAPVVGKCAATLSNEVNPRYPTAKFGLADAVALSKWTHDPEILNCFAAEMGHMTIPLAADVPGVEGIGPHTAHLAREFADVMARVSDDLADGQVSANELAAIEREAGELITALQSLLGAIRAMHVAGAPAEAAVGSGLAPLRRVGA